MAVTKGKICKLSLIFLLDLYDNRNPFSVIDEPWTLFVQEIVF